MNLTQRLAGVDLFAGLPDDVLGELVSHGVTLTARPGDMLVEQGSTQTGLQLVLEGSADVSVSGASRKALRPGDYFGEISLIDGAPRSATVTAGSSGLKTFALSSLSFSPVLDSHPEIARVLLVALCARLRSLETPAVA